MLKKIKVGTNYLNFYKAKEFLPGLCGFGKKKRSSSKFQVTICSHREIKPICSVLEWMDFSSQTANRRVIKNVILTLAGSKFSKKNFLSFQKNQLLVFLKTCIWPLGQSFSSMCITQHGLWSKNWLTSSVITSCLFLFHFSKLQFSQLKKKTIIPYFNDYFKNFIRGGKRRSYRLKVAETNLTYVFSANSEKGNIKSYEASIT